MPCLAGAAARSASATGLPSTRIVAGVRLVDAGQDLDERRLAGAVLADQRRHLRRDRATARHRASARTPGKDFEIRSSVSVIRDVLASARSSPVDASSRIATLSMSGRVRLRGSRSEASAGRRGSRPRLGGRGGRPDEGPTARRPGQPSPDQKILENSSMFEACRRLNGSAIAPSLLSSSVTLPMRPIDSSAPGLASALPLDQVVGDHGWPNSRGRSGSRSRTTWRARRCR